MAITKDTLANLAAMRLPDLWALYEEAFGEPTRCPNKTFLIRKLTEAAETSVADNAAEDTNETHTETEAPADEAPSSADELAGAADQATDAPADTEATSDTRGGADKETAAEPVRLTKLSVDELRARYVEVIGRETSSTNKAYLVWKLREAAKGRIPIGPRSNARRGGSDIATEHKVLPLRMPAETVAVLDEVWRRRDMKSRTALIREALRHYLSSLGETEAAQTLRGA